MEAVASQHAIDGQAMVFCREIFQAAQGTVKDAFTANVVVGEGGATVQADLKVERVKLLETLGALWRNQGAVGANAHYEAALCTTFEDIPEGRVDKWFAAAEVNLKYLHLRHLIDQGQSLLFL